MSLTRRQFLTRVGQAGGFGATYVLMHLPTAKSRRASRHAYQPLVYGVTGGLPQESCSTVICQHNCLSGGWQPSCCGAAGTPHRTGPPGEWLDSVARLRCGCRHAWHQAQVGTVRNRRSGPRSRPRSPQPACFQAVARSGPRRMPAPEFDPLRPIGTGNHSRLECDRGTRR